MLIQVKGQKADKYEVRQRAERDARRFEDIKKGLTVPKGPQRGDFSLCRDLDKRIKEYHRFKSKPDRKKIESEYFGLQQEYRKNKVLGR